MIPQRIPDPFSELINDDELCAIAQRWGLELDLLERIVQARYGIPFDIWIFSGARSKAHQEDISATPFAVSTHADRDDQDCPRLSTGADVQPISPGNRIRRAPTVETAVHLPVALFGAAMVRAGLRWGGGAPTDPNTGFPIGNEVWHVDLGARG